MYLPAHFAVDDAGTLHDLIRSHPLATLITESPDGPVADHIPLRLADDGAHLSGHVARANPLWKTHPAEHPVLAIFHGPDAYVSPNWYPSKREHGKAVPTWNYVAVHVRGRLRIIDDPAWLRAELARLVDAHEAPLPEPWRLADAPADYLDKMFAAVVGIELSIVSIQGKWKLSQNQPAANRDGVIAGLRTGGAAGGEDVAALMEARREG